MQVLTEQLGVKCIMGITCAANASIRDYICKSLGIETENVCIAPTSSLKPPDNVKIHVQFFSKDEDDKILVN